MFRNLSKCSRKAGKEYWAPSSLKQNKNFEHISLGFVDKHIIL